MIKCPCSKDFLLFLGSYPGGWGVLPYKRPIGMCRWMRLHFHDWIYYHGVAFSIELIEWGRTFSNFWAKTVLHIYGLQAYQNVCTVGEK